MGGAFVVSEIFFGAEHRVYLSHYMYMRACVMFRVHTRVSSEINRGFVDIMTIMFVMSVTSVTSIVFTLFDKYPH